MELLDLPSSAVDALRRLRMHVNNPTHDKIEDLRRTGIVWLTLTPSRRQIEEEGAPANTALEALARLRLVDHDAWIAAIEELWPVETKKLRHLLAGRDFRLGLEFATSDQTLLAKYSGRFLQWGSGFLGDSRARVQLEGVADLSIPVRLTLLGTNHFTIGPFQELLHEAADLVEAAGDRAPPVNAITGRASVPLYHIVEVMVAKYSTGRWAADDVAGFHRFAACGVRVWCPLEVSRFFVQTSSSRLLIKPLQELLGAIPTTVANGKFLATASIRVSLLSDRQLLDSVFSGVMGSHSIRQVVASDPSVIRPGSRERAWQWLAVVVRMPIQELTLDCQNLLAEDLEAFQSSLSSVNPLKSLFPAAPEQPVVASASRFRLEPRFWIVDGTRDDEATFVSDAPMENLPVVGIDEDAEGWVTVLLPGWGRAWVSRADASLTTVAESSQLKAGPRHISLTNLRSDQSPTVLAFLQLVGHQVLKISLSPSKRHETHIHVDGILEGLFLACPHLEELTITSMALASLNSLAVFYEKAVCRVKHLVLENVYVHDKSDAVDFFRHLADTNHLITRHLQTMYCTTPERVERFPSIQPAVFRMLQLNHQLYDFHMEVGDPTFALRLDDTIPLEAFDPFNVEIITERFALRNKLAFLSVVLANDDSTEEGKTDTCSDLAQPRSALHSLDRNVLTTVLQFAGQTYTRCVRVQFC